jgi:hypothetical protein
MHVNKLLEKREDLIHNLEESWPKVFETILREYRHEGQPFYIYTFCKTRYHDTPPSYNIYHQPRKTIPDAFPGTILRKIYPKRGLAEIIWTLPQEEFFSLYKKGKAFHDPVVLDFIQKYQKGELTEEHLMEKEKYSKV